MGSFRFVAGCRAGILGLAPPETSGGSDSVSCSPEEGCSPSSIELSSGSGSGFMSLREEVRILQN